LWYRFNAEPVNNGEKMSDKFNRNTEFLLLRRELAIEILLQCFDYRVSENVTVRGAHNLSEEDYQLARQEIEGQMETFDRIFSAEYTGSCWNEGLTRLYREDNNNNNGDQS
jgi:hypothetical protein